MKRKLVPAAMVALAAALAATPAFASKVETPNTHQFTGSGELVRVRGFDF